MRNTWIGFIIVLSIALQSFVTVASSNENHQVDAQHLQTEHSHDTDHQALEQKSSESEHNVNDCHHCGHCQGSHTQWLSTTKSSSIMSKPLIPNQYFYLINIDKSFIEQPIRPPIA